MTNICWRVAPPQAVLTGCLPSRSFGPLPLTQFLLPCLHRPPFGWNSTVSPSWLPSSPLLLLPFFQPLSLCNAVFYSVFTKVWVLTLRSASAVVRPWLPLPDQLLQIPLSSRLHPWPTPVHFLQNANCVLLTCAVWKLPGALRLPLPLLPVPRPDRCLHPLRLRELHHLVNHAVAGCAPGWSS